MNLHPSRRRASLLLGCAVLLGFAALPAGASPPPSDVEFEVRDRDADRTLPVYRRDGRAWVEGQPRHEYSIVIRNRSPRRVLAVVSVDGVNVVTGETASPSQSGYVLDPWQSTSIDGWRKSLDGVAAFRFTRLANSYAARTGRPNDVGVIGIAVFRELAPPPVAVEPQLREEESWRANSAERRARAGSDAYDSASSSAAASAAAADAAAPPASGSAARSAPRVAQQESVAKESSRLGTAHGRRLESRAQWTNFERASSTPDEVHTLWYDSRENLVAMGVLPPPDRYADRARVPQPFPGGFVPDP